MSFTEDLSISLSLAIAGQTYTVQGGNVKSLAVALYPWGFTASVSFIVATEQAQDTLLQPLTSDNLVEVTLQAEVYIKPSDAQCTPLKLSGIATARSFQEQTLTNVLPTQTLMLYRLYQIDFADPATVLWRQHYPCELLVNSNLQTLIAGHTGEKISLKYDWDALNTQYPVLSLPLGSPGNAASFYDYLIWLVDTQNGVFSYDAANNAYSLAGQKPAVGQAQTLNFLEVSGYTIGLSPVWRYQPNVLNAYSESPQTTPITNQQTINPMRRDYIARYPIAADMQDRVNLETARFIQRKPAVRVGYQQFPLVVCPPWQAVNLQGTGWSTSLYVHGNTYRVREWRLQARVVNQDWPVDLNMPYTRYDMEHDLILEASDEQAVDLPAYTPPVYPFFVEGKVVSEQGEANESTYQFYQDQNTSVNYYQVSIPLWENKQVRTAYQPSLDTGQFYFPPYKNARVLVGLGFNSAFIANFLDWGSGTALPLDTQGNQLVMGKNTTNQTILKHTYVDNKPELQIQRTLQQDTELLQFSDGYILLQTQQSESQGGGG